MTQDKIITAVTALIGLAAMVFGMSKETTSILVAAVPQVVGGAMAIASIVTYLVNRSKQRTEVFQALAFYQAPKDDAGLPRDVSSNNENVLALAKKLGMM